MKAIPKDLELLLDYPGELGDACDCTDETFCLVCRILAFFEQEEPSRVTLEKHLRSVLEFFDGSEYLREAVDDPRFYELIDEIKADFIGAEAAVTKEGAIMSDKAARLVREALETLE